MGQEGEDKRHGQRRQIYDRRGVGGGDKTCPRSPRGEVDCKHQRRGHAALQFARSETEILATPEQDRERRKLAYLIIASTATEVVEGPDFFPKAETAFVGHLAEHFAIGMREEKT